MKQAIRKDEILNILARYNYVTVEFLAEALYISPSSVRRDLARLEAQGLVRRSHGGVHSIEVQNSLTPYSLRIQENSTRKRVICQKAIELVRDGDVVFIDGSTTCLFLPELLEQKKNITVLTNSLHVAAMLGKNDRVRVYCTGGMMRLQDELVMSGTIAEQCIGQIRSNVMFFSSRAIDDDGMISDLNEPETALRRAALRHTDKAVFLCDHTKFGQHSTFTVCHANELACIVTDLAPEELPPRSWQAEGLLWK